MREYMCKTSELMESPFPQKFKVGSTGTEKYASERSMNATKDMGYIHSMQLSILYILKK